MNISSLLRNIDEIRLVGISESKLDSSVSNHEKDIEYYDLIRIDHSKRRGEIACYIRKSFSYNRKLNFCPNTESIFVDIF